MITMKENNIPLIVIGITVILALAMFALQDHSGLSAMDCTFQKDNSEVGKYNLSYTLLVGRHFNLLDCQYILYDENNSIITNGSSKLENTYAGSFPINNEIYLENNSTTPKKADIIIYTEIVKENNGVKNTYMEKSYTKSFEL